MAAGRVYLPGPAGRLQALRDAGKQITAASLGLEDGSGGPGGRSAASVSDAALLGLGFGLLGPDGSDPDFASPAWQEALSSFDVESFEDLRLLLPHTLRSAASRPFQRVPKLLAVVTSLTPSPSGDCYAQLKDPTGQMGAAMHVEAVEAATACGLAAGAVLLLQQVVVICPSPGLHYLCVTADNIMQVFPPAQRPPRPLTAPTPAFPQRREASSGHAAPTQPQQPTQPHLPAGRAANGPAATRELCPPPSGPPAGRPPSQQPSQPQVPQLRRPAAKAPAPHATHGPARGSGPQHFDHDDGPISLEDDDEDTADKEALFRNVRPSQAPAAQGASGSVTQPHLQFAGGGQQQQQPGRQQGAAPPAAALGQLRQQAPGGPGGVAGGPRGGPVHTAQPSRPGSSAAGVGGRQGRQLLGDLLGGDADGDADLMDLDEALGLVGGGPQPNAAAAPPPGPVLGRGPGGHALAPAARPQPGSGPAQGAPLGPRAAALAAAAAAPAGAGTDARPGPGTARGREVLELPSGVGLRGGVLKAGGGLGGARPTASSGSCGPPAAPPSGRKRVFGLDDLDEDLELDLQDNHHPTTQPHKHQQAAMFHQQQRQQQQGADALTRHGQPAHGPRPPQRRQGVAGLVGLDDTDRTRAGLVEDTDMGVDGLSMELDLDERTAGQTGRAVGVPAQQQHQQQQQQEQMQRHAGHGALKHRAEPREAFAGALQGGGGGGGGGGGSVTPPPPARATGLAGRGGSGEKGPHSGAPAGAEGRSPAPGSGGSLFARLRTTPPPQGPHVAAAPAAAAAVVAAQGAPPVGGLLVAGAAALAAPTQTDDEDMLEKEEEEEDPAGQGHGGLGSAGRRGPAGGVPVFSLLGKRPAVGGAARRPGPGAGAAHGGVNGGGGGSGRRELGLMPPPPPPASQVQVQGQGQGVQRRGGVYMPPLSQVSSRGQAAAPRHVPHVQQQQQQQQPNGHGVVQQPAGSVSHAAAGEYDVQPSQSQGPGREVESGFRPPGHVTHGGGAAGGGRRAGGGGGGGSQGAQGGHDELRDAALMPPPRGNGAVQGQGLPRPITNATDLFYFSQPQ